MGSRSANYRKQLVIEWFERGYVICGICWQKIEELNQLTVDHIIPRAKRGDSRKTNMQPAHEKCNQKKADKLLAQPTDKKSILNYIDTNKLKVSNE